jgi:hypothetical protein
MAAVALREDKAPQRVRWTLPRPSRPTPSSIPCARLPSKFRPCHANARCSRLGCGHQYACGPLTSRSKLLPHNEMGSLR